MAEPTRLELADEGDALAKAAPRSPWFVSDDEACDAPAHKNSGLALVDTGRVYDWSLARLSEWPGAKFIAWLGTNWPAISAALRSAEEDQHQSARRICDLEEQLANAEEEIKRLRRMIEAYDAAAALERGVGINMHDVMVTAQKETMTKLIAAEAVLADMRQTAETMRAFIQRTALLSHPIGRDAGQFLDALDSLTPPEHSPKDAPPQAPSAPSPDSAQE